MDINDLPKCIECARPMRPRGTTQADYPNTLKRASRGMCGSCYMSKQDNRALYPTKTNSRDRVQIDASEHSAVLVCRCGWRGITLPSDALEASARHRTGCKA